LRDAFAEARTPQTIVEIVDDVFLPLATNFGKGGHRFHQVMMLGNHLLMRWGRTDYALASGPGR
jgi:hypothetical protein